MQQQLEQYFDRLWPITRSLTGNGNRESLAILSELVDLKVSEVPCGTACFDWNVPPEWNINSAWIKDSKGNVIVDMANNNLHVLGYSTPVNATLTWEELEPHLYTLPEQPDLIPYITSYYKERWGFCLSHNQYERLDKTEKYEVFIDSSLNKDGSMTVAEALIQGQTDEEILFSTYICHPSMANNELSGPLVTAFLYQKLKEKQAELTYSYRFLFVPETIGTIYQLSQLGEHWKEKLKAGFVVTCIGDDGKFTYKKSRRGNALVDRVAQTILDQTEEDYNLVEFFPRGSDERQYCSPGFNLPVGSMTRTMYGVYPEYHTSGDNKDFISFAAMEKSVERFWDFVQLIEKNKTYINTMPYCEPQLGKRGLYPTLSEKKKSNFVDAMMWLLNYSDGEHDLIDISQKSNIAVQEFYPVIDKLLENGILK